jgi:wyosine [tRNA(Phe)-imidazoG37] synthetase (radical SAM superfamily)
VRAFGPVPSRRLGRSLGVNNIPPKICSYSCIYCQVGRTKEMPVERRAFYAPDEIARDVRTKVQEARTAGETIDYVAFVPDGEPTLDANLGREIETLRPLGIPIAVISNASLIWQEDVRADLMKADWVSLKVDAVDEQVWHRVDRPHRSLRMDRIREGMLAFVEVFRGELVTETMLVEGINDQPEYVEQVADLLAKLHPATAYLSVPIRPPAEKRVRAPGEDTLQRAYQILSHRVERVEYLIGYEGDAFASTGDPQQDLLSITAVHPMRRDAVEAFIQRAGVEWSAVQDLIDSQQLAEVTYEGNRFYVRGFSKRA